MRFILAAVLLFASPVFAQDDSDKLGLHHESELGYIVVGGNAKSQSFSGKQETWYQMTSDLAKLKGHYLNTRALNPQTGQLAGTAENWSAAFRWEHIYLPELFSVFAEAGMRGNRFIGVDMGQSYDVGGKYTIISKENFNWFAELGYQYLKEDLIDDGDPLTARQDYREAHFIRLYSKASYSYSPSIKFELWGEYLPDMKDEENYRVNFGPSVLAILNDTFSLKFGYEGNYRNIPVSPNKIYFDYRHVTALIAKF